VGLHVPGGIASLLRVLDDHPDVVEADLARWYHCDLRDLWRVGADGGRLLTLRMLAVRIRHLPADSALARLQNDGHTAWTLHDFLVSDVFQALTGKVHPARPKPQAKRPAMSRDRARKWQELRQRAAERRAADTT